MNAIVKEGRLVGEKTKVDAVCEMCATAKQMRKTFKVSDEGSEVRKSARSDAVVCLDALEPTTSASKSRFKYIVNFIMIKSRHVMI